VIRTLHTYGLMAISPYVVWGYWAAGPNKVSTSDERKAKPGAFAPGLLGFDLTTTSELLRQNNGVDDVDHAIGTHDVRLRDFGAVHGHAIITDGHIEFAALQ